MAMRASVAMGVGVSGCQRGHGCQGAGVAVSASVPMGASVAVGVGVSGCLWVFGCLGATVAMGVRVPVWP